MSARDTVVFHVGASANGMVDGYYVAAEYDPAPADADATAQATRWYSTYDEAVGARAADMDDWRAKGCAVRVGRDPGEDNDA
jgi:hypothetical protein